MGEIFIQDQSQLELLGWYQLVLEGGVGASGWVGFRRGRGSAACSLSLHLEENTAFVLLLNLQ